MRVLVIVTILTSYYSSNCWKAEGIPKRVRSGIQELATVGSVNPDLSKALIELGKITDPVLADDTFCRTCEAVIDEYIAHRKSGANRETMGTLARHICDNLSDWGPVPCQGYINIELDTALYIIDNTMNLTAARVCGIYYQYKNCKDPNPRQWSVDIPASNGIPEDKKQDSTVHSKVLHLSDFHYDPLYKEGTNADCDLPLCCEEESGPPVIPEKAAGFWGDYRVCDTPWRAVTNLMDHITEQGEQFNSVYFTGDIVSHRSWASTKDHNAQALKDIFKLLHATFKSIPVYPILGNHEPHPSDFYSPGVVKTNKVSTQWVFDLAATEWARWLPQDTQKTIRQGGYYTVLVRPGFRIIALNSNVCFTFNFWLLYDDVDPYGQLQWLVDTLVLAEKNSERVHILSHIPPGQIECLESWSAQFKRIVDRFAPIISAQFNGHTHMDEMRIFYDTENPTKVTNVAYNGGSLTTFIGFNPNYRIYDIDSTNLNVQDYDQYTYNLTKANENPSNKPDWYKLYSFKDAYGLKSTSYEEIGGLVERLQNDPTLLAQYQRFLVRDSDVQMAKGCDNKCQYQLRCSLKSVEAKDALRCQELKRKIA